MNLKSLSPDELRLYKRHKKNRLFNDKYYEVTGREYIAMYPRNRPFHKMWRADYFGQQYWVSTKEAHFTEFPPDEKLGEITTHGKARVIPNNAPRLLQEYRTGRPLNMTLTVLSCAPQVFEIQDFLSRVEIDHIMKLAKGLTLSRSKVYNEIDASVRTSYNTWVKREMSPIIDAIYRRAADVFRVDEALLRYRGDSEYPDLGTKTTVAESLQLVHYGAGQKLDPHHDFVIADINNPYQPARFATLLIYLNDGFVGGETVFHRWVNAETSEALKVDPEMGKAILFYSHLPDGNFDDRSLHASLPVKEGEKWVMNLWLWDPIYKQ
jgi:prolyl 4-hydroxylase